MIEVLQGVIIAASLVFVAFAWRRSLAAGVLLPYAARRPVPWEAFGGAGLAAMLVVLQVAAYFSTSPLAAGAAPAMTDDEFITASVLSLQLLVLVGFVMLTLKQTGGAGLDDFGLGSLAGRWRSDVVLGAATGLFLFGPVYLLYIATALVVKQESQNPVLLQLAESGNPLVFAAAFFSAVIVAPVFEELVFRSLLQGWLEKAEDQLLGWRKRKTEARSEQEPPTGDKESSTAVADDANPFASPLANDRLSPPDSNVTPPSTATIAGLPHGWVPMLISGLAFALVHLGAGPDPVPLLLFGVIQGYVYQRTHRILPCILSHAIFNGVSLTLAWVEVVTG